MTDASRALLCRADEDILLLVDMQTNLAAAMPERDTTLRNAARLSQGAALLDVPVLVTEQYPKGLGPTDPELQSALPQGAKVFDKTAFSCCGASGLSAALRDSGRKQVVIAGMEAHVCVTQTALELSAEGWPVFVAEDAVCSRAAANKASALHRLRQSGVVVTTTESVLFEWMRDARHARFKAVSALIR